MSEITDLTQQETEDLQAYLNGLRAVRSSDGNGRIFSYLENGQVISTDVKQPSNLDNQEDKNLRDFLAALREIRESGGTGEILFRLDNGDVTYQDVKTRRFRQPQHAPVKKPIFVNWNGIQTRVTREMFDELSNGHTCVYIDHTTITLDNCLFPDEE
jgi:hypothetical protein